MNILTGVLFILVISYIIYLIASYYIIPKPVKQIGQDTIYLSTVTQVSSSETLKGSWTSASGSSLMFYINPSIADRTGVSGNEYASVIQIGSTQKFKILVAPDAGRGINMSPAVFEIYVNGYTKPELVEIPNFPLQRWSFVAIVKDGRRFNIYINGKIAVSHLCAAMPDFDETQPLRVGDPRLNGKISLITMATYALQTNEIREIYKNSTDGSGKPYMPITVKNIVMPFLQPFTSFSIPNGFWCPDGVCSTPKSAGPLNQWTSPYA